MNTNHIVRFIHRLAAIVAISSFALVARAAETEIHNPYTVRGFQVRTNLLPEQSASAYSSLSISEAVGPTLFQEMAPCRFVSTLDPDQYPAQWGGLSFQVSESRVYHPIGYLAEGLFKNPCSELIPPQAVALAVRLGAPQPLGDGSVFLAPSSSSVNISGNPALVFKKNLDSVQEATVVLHDNAFVVTTAEQATELTIDIIGFFIKDETGRGAKGDQGERGEMGPAGPQGLQGANGVAGATGEKGADGVAGAKGEKGDKGDNGVAGATGEKGDKGDNGVAGAKGEKGDKGDEGVAGAKGEKGDKGDDGVAGAKGEKGDKGDNGVAGAKGEKGDKGADGVAGAKGEKGDKGDNGVAGAKGEKGDKGDNGVAGAKGEKGDKGDNGVAGAKGEKGNDGVAGAKGEKGDKGERGLQGERGERGTQGERGLQGPQGPQGTPGVTMSVGESIFPPRGIITINDGAVRANSVIILLYIEVSNGNALGVASQSVGSFVATGSPNKPFKYIILTAN
jgi:hypothetical protein